MVEQASVGGYQRAQDTHGCPSQVGGYLRILENTWEYLGILEHVLLITESKSTQDNFRSTSVYLEIHQCCWVLPGNTWEYLA